MKCPNHNSQMVVKKTLAGPLLVCPVAGCEMACWFGDTSTPADRQTRALRHQCHEALDPLWMHRIKFSSRQSAYAWLKRVMGLPVAYAHIGMMSAEQCRKLLSEIERLTAGAPARSGGVV